MVASANSDVNSKSVSHGFVCRCPVNCRDGERNKWNGQSEVHLLSAYAVEAISVITTDHNSCSRLRYGGVGVPTIEPIHASRNRVSSVDSRQGRCQPWPTG